MNKSATATILLVTGGLVGLAPSVATGDTQNGLNISDNDSVYVDGKSFQLVPGKAKGDAAVQIKSLAARDLGPAAIIIRSGNKLYIVDAQSQMAIGQSQAAAAPASYAYDPRPYNPAALGGGSVGYNHQVATDFAYDPRSINPTLQGGGSTGYNRQVATDYAYDPRQGYPVRNPDPWANNYAYDPQRVAAAQPSIIYDSDYVEYRLKKAFEDNWTPAAAPTSTK